MITLTRVYNHGDVIETRAFDAKSAMVWVKGMLIVRANCALFVNGICVHEGLLGKQKCAELEKSWR